MQVAGICGDTGQSIRKKRVVEEERQENEENEEDGEEEDIMALEEHSLEELRDHR